MEEPQSIFVLGVDILAAYLTTDMTALSISMDGDLFNSAALF